MSDIDDGYDDEFEDDAEGIKTADNSIVDNELQKVSIEIILMHYYIFFPLYNLVELKHF